MHRFFAIAAVPSAELVLSFGDPNRARARFQALPPSSASVGLPCRFWSNGTLCDDVDKQRELAASFLADIESVVRLAAEEA